MGALVPLRRQEPIAGALYDRLAARYNRLLDEGSALNRKAKQIERQFLDGDLCTLAGPNRGRPLSRAWRLNRLQRYAELEIRCRDNFRDQMRLWEQINGEWASP